MFAKFVLARASFVMKVTLTVHAVISLLEESKLLALDNHLENLIDSFAPI